MSWRKTIRASNWRNQTCTIWAKTTCSSYTPCGRDTARYLQCCCIHPQPVPQKISWTSLKTPPHTSRCNAISSLATSSHNLNVIWRRQRPSGSHRCSSFSAWYRLTVSGSQPASYKWSTPSMGKWLLMNKLWQNMKNTMTNIKDGGSMKHTGFTLKKRTPCTTLKKLFKSISVKTRSVKNGSSGSNW